MTGTAAKRRSRAKVPDVLGEGGRVRVLADLLAQAQEQSFRLEATRIANGHQLDDPVVGLPQTRPDGTVQSYRLLLSESSEQVERLRDTYPDAWTAVQRLVRERDRA